MGIIKIIFVLVSVSLIMALLKSLFGKRGGRGQLPDKSSDTDFIAEELYKLNELKNRGILTEEEFRKQKNKLLNK